MDLGPLPHRQTDVPPVPDHMNESRFGPEPVQCTDLAHVVRSLVPNQGLTFGPSVEIQDRRNQARVRRWLAVSCQPLKLFLPADTQASEFRMCGQFADQLVRDQSLPVQRPRLLVEVRDPVRLRCDRYLWVRVDHALQQSRSGPRTSYDE